MFKQECSPINLYHDHYKLHVRHPPQVVHIWKTFFVEKGGVSQMSSVASLFCSLIPIGLPCRATDNLESEGS